MILKGGHRKGLQIKYILGEKMQKGELVLTTCSKKKKEKTVLLLFGRHIHGCINNIWDS